MVSMSRCFAAKSASVIAASAPAASRRAARFPPSGSCCDTWTITGMEEKSTGAFQSWTISIGSSRAPAGDTDAFTARTRASAAFKSGFFSRASRIRSASRIGAAIANASTAAIIECLPSAYDGMGGRPAGTRVPATDVQPRLK